MRRPLRERIGDALAARGLSLGLDLKLGVRMLVKYPMLSIVGGLAITVATALGVGVTEFVRDLVAPELPLDEGDRIVRLYHLDAEEGGQAPASLYDLQLWRESVSSLEDVGAFTTMEQGAVSDRGEVGTLSLARTSAAAFRVTRIAPLHGRYLLDEDERPEAPPVVLGYQAWQTLLAGDPDPVGREVQLAGSPATVVGVMPEGYGFPENQNAWVPLKFDGAALTPESAPRAALFARLAPGATLESARAELAVAGQRAAAAFPEVYQRLTPAVSRFADRGPTALVAIMLTVVRVLFVFLLAIICANVATLVFARTVAREGEIAVRSSLGASRRRIALQLFAEALVLVGGATLLGLAIARFALGRIGRLFFTIQQAPQPPFWWNDALSPATVVYALVLAVVAAILIGVVPALKATKGSVQPRLQQLSSGGGGGLRLGAVSTVVIVLQVAISVGFIPVAATQARTAFEDPLDTGFPADEYLTAQLGRDPVVPPRTPEERASFNEDTRRLFDEVRDRLAADPGVQGVAFASGLSAMNHIGLPLEFVAGRETPPVSGGARILLVDPAYLDLMGASTVAGQTLMPAHFGPQARAVVVNQAFVETVLDGRNPIGGELRFTERDGESGVVRIFPPGTTVDVVGVVRDPGIDVFGPGAHPAIYAPLDLAPVEPQAAGFVGMPQPPVIQLFVRARPGAGWTAGRLYELVSAVDPTLRVSGVGTAASAWAGVHQGARIGGWIFMAVAGIVLMLSIAGIYALMSFIVSRRTREIAIRAAMGARPAQIVGSVFRRAALQLLAGVAPGSLIAIPVLLDGVEDRGPLTLVVVAVLLLGGGLVACLAPVRRALAIEPAAAMKAE